MEENSSILLQQGLNTAFINGDNPSSSAYKPLFISNNYKEGRKVISAIESELRTCDQFFISVAFITVGGVTPLLQTLKELERKNVKGCILTTDYLNFSEPEALRRLGELKNVTLKMYFVKDSEEGFHTKGYIFKNEEMYRIIVGSSNMTLSALTKNKEWNTKIVSTEQGEYTTQVIKEYNQLWNSELALSYDEFIEGYSAYYQLMKKKRIQADQSQEIDTSHSVISANKMQQAFISNLKKIIEKKEKRALLISATGTGKTYASAFALKELKVKKALFVVHREQIAKQAMASFKRVFGSSKKFGLLSGNSKEFQVDFLFSTLQTMSKDNILSQFKKEEFNFIIIDEAHRSAASMYQKIMNYFEPEFWLGMTASPERTDNFDIYQLFDHNIAYEIRLQQALEANLLCPFHYFGVTDLQIDGQSFDESTGLKNFNLLTCDQRVNYIIEQIQYYGHSGDRVKGLIFCSSKKEAAELSVKFNAVGYKTEVLTGEDSQQQREQSVERLVSDELDNKLDYIFTVDIFNEGVDIPEVNQVVMLRPTESPIVFIQQLGRGLRKAVNKEFVVILDFIGNYKNNFMIPVALSGDRSYNKDNLRRYLVEGQRIIPGSSTIHFDEISRAKIFTAIDSANFNDVKLIKENYFNLKYKLGRIPKLQDFDQYGEMDCLRIFDNQSLGSYYKFLKKYEKDYLIRLSILEENLLEFVSKKLASGKRIHELELLRCAFTQPNQLFSRLKQTLNETYKITLDERAMHNVINVLTNVFPVGLSKETYAECVFIETDVENSDYRVTKTFAAMLKNQNFNSVLLETIEFGIERYKLNYSDRYMETNLVLYQKYTYEDVCRLLNWENNEVPLNIGGYKYDSKTKTLPVFINYNKNEDIRDTIKYQDQFINANHLIAISKQSRTLQSDDVQNFINAKQRGIQVELFVRKNKDDKMSKEFYYLGKMSVTGKTKEFVMENTDKSAVELEWILNTPIREDIYDYIVNE